jgi:prophage maintenance system killer protein
VSGRFCGAFERKSPRSRRVVHLKRLGLGDIAAVNSSHSFSLLMNPERDLHGLIALLVEKLQEHFNDEFHRGVVIVVQDDCVSGRLLELGSTFLDCDAAVLSALVGFFVGLNHGLNDPRFPDTQNSTNAPRGATGPNQAARRVISIHLTEQLLSGIVAPMPESLARQLERTRFERALSVSESMADHRVLLTTMELVRLNNILTGHKDDVDPWRREPVTLTLKSGKPVSYALITDPVLTTRERLHAATALAEGGNVIDAAVDIYVGLVLSHVFQDANRRTAVLAAHYFLKRYGIPLSGVALHEIGLGDLRQEGQIEALKETIHQMAKFASKRNPKT